MAMELADSITGMRASIAPDVAQDVDSLADHFGAVACVSAGRLAFSEITLLTAFIMQFAADCGDRVLRFARRKLRWKRVYSGRETRV